MNKTLPLLILICLIFAAVASFRLDLRVVTDESWLCVPAYSLLSSGVPKMTIFRGADDGSDRLDLGSPLQGPLLAATFKVFGFGLEQGRALSLLFGLLAILGTFLLARQLYDDRVALAAAALIAADNFFFLAARTIRGEIFLTAFLLFSVYFLLAGFRRGGSLRFLLSGVFAGLAFLAHPNAIIGLAALFFIMLAENGRMVLVKRSSWLCLAGAVIAILPYAIFVLVLTYPDKFYFITGQYLVGSRMGPVFGPGWLWHSLRGELFDRYADLIAFPYRFHVFVIAAAALAYALANRKKADRFLLIMVVTWLVLLWLIIVNKTARYTTAFAPYLWILVAAVLIRAGEKGRELFRWGAFGLIGLLVASQLAGNLLFFRLYAGSGYQRLAARIRRIVPPEAAVYGPTTYWLALYDHVYYGSEKVPFTKARSRFRPQVYIIGAREFSEGREYHGLSRRRALQAEIKRYLAKNGRLIGQLNNAFYGKLRFYAVD